MVKLFGGRAASAIIGLFMLAIGSSANAQDVASLAQPAVAVTQVQAAPSVTTRVPAAKKAYFLAKDVGHDGIFNGRKWREKISPVVEKFVAANNN